MLLLTTTEHRAVAHAFAPHEFVRIDSKRCVLDFVPAAKIGFGLVFSSGGGGERGRRTVRQLAAGGAWSRAGPTRAARKEHHATLP